MTATDSPAVDMPPWKVVESSRSFRPGMAQLTLLVAEPRFLAVLFLLLLVLVTIIY